MNIINKYNLTILSDNYHDSIVDDDEKIRIINNYLTFIKKCDLMYNFYNLPHIKQQLTPLITNMICIFTKYLKTPDPFAAIKTFIECKQFIILNKELHYLLYYAVKLLSIDECKALGIILEKNHPERLDKINGIHNQPIINAFVKISAIIDAIDNNYHHVATYLTHSIVKDYNFRELPLSLKEHIKLIYSYWDKLLIKNLYYENLVKFLLNNSRHLSTQGITTILKFMLNCSHSTLDKIVVKTISKTYACELDLFNICSSYTSLLSKAISCQTTLIDLKLNNLPNDELIAKNFIDESGEVILTNDLVFGLKNSKYILKIDYLFTMVSQRILDIINNSGAPIILKSPFDNCHISSDEIIKIQLN